MPSYISPRLVFGWDALDELNKIKETRIALVSDPVMRDLGILADVEQRLARNETRVVGCVNREPYFTGVESIIHALLEMEPDVIVALGGGSVMDAAKAAWAFYENPALDWQTALMFNGIPEPPRRAELIAIPTTSGTGSEVSRVAVLIDPQTRMKRLVMSPHIVPTLALLDPTLTLTMPPALTAHSAFDALTHAIEALVTRATNELVRANALHAIRLIFDALPAAYASGERTAREKMHLAATLASLAVSNSMAGLAHGMDQVGPLFGVPHGLVCAILLPYTMAFNLLSVCAAYAEMGAAIGVPQCGTCDRGAEFLRRVIGLERAVNLPISFHEIGIHEREYFGAMELLIAATLDSRSTQLGPRLPTADQAYDLFERAYWGHLPEWVA